MKGCGVMPTSIKLYLYTVIAVGMTALILSLFLTDYSNIYIILALGVIAGILDKYLIELPNGTFFSGTLAFTFIALIFMGVEEAVLVEFIVFLVSLLFSRNINIKNLFNVSQYILCIFLSGNVYQIGMNSSNLFDWKVAILILLTIAIHTLLNFLIVSVILSTIQGKNYWVTFVDIFLDGIFIYITTTILCFILAYLYSFNNMTLFFVITGFVFICYFAVRYAFGLFIQLRKIYLTSMEMLTDIEETKLLISRGHSTRVGKFARRLAEELKLPQEEIDAIHYAALFHDMGKLRLEDQIFKKRGPLTIEEEKEYRQHVELGSSMVKEISGLENTAEYVLYHHERWDGKGFPAQLAQDAIPLGARIIATVNELDHLLYDSKIKLPESEFTKLAGNKLDPKLVKLCVKIFEEFHVESVAKYEEPIDIKVIDEVKVRLARKELQASKVIHKIGVAQVALFDGVFKDEKGQEIKLPIEESLKHLIAKVKQEHVGVRDFIEDAKNGNVYDAYCFPTGTGYQIILMDLTNILEYEKKQDERINTLYREVMFSVTEGKFVLISKEELEEINHQKVIGPLPIESKGDVPLCRQQVQEVLTQLDIPGKISFQILLCTSEVVTNVLKHAVSGQMKINYVEGKLQIIVQDKGSGMDLAELPKSTLLSGYSSKVSMGQGFNLILKMMDRVKLFTSSEGTTVVLEIQLSEHINMNTPHKLA
jgi:HD-GYP domain-containing protein (c-di-GMP phosphodiesterase class II)/anti-sigma regulatory factor (Ser/Thr protein kinase)